ncbi:MAG: GerMN domain-containing protein [Defluviitaleaceae bacterium]|nr:GerMN domain-containing protein [Defluviitaleaceae bacterium]
MDKFLDFFRRLSRVHIASIIFVTVLIAGGIVATVLAQRNFGVILEDSRAIYFFSPSDGRLTAEFHPIPSPTPPVGVISMVDMAMTHLLAGPRRSGLSQVWPRDLEYHDLILGLEMYENTLIATFSEAYHQMSPLDEALFRGAFTLTMVGLPDVDEVQMRVAYVTEYGTNWNERTESAATIANYPSISPTRISNATFSLFFVDETGEGLVVETYFAEGINIRRRERDVVERLIAGSSDLYFTPAVSIPEGTRVRDVITGEGVTDIYVDLSSAFLTGFSGTPTQANLMIGSIVNTLIESTPGPRTRRVFFLIDSVRREDFHGVENFHLEFTFNERLMLGFTEEVEDYDDEEEDN